jgi:hypothetical protein
LDCVEMTNGPRSIMRYPGSLDAALTQYFSISKK